MATRTIQVTDSWGTAVAQVEDAGVTAVAVTPPAGGRIGKMPEIDFDQLAAAVFGATNGHAVASKPKKAAKLAATAKPPVAAAPKEPKKATQEEATRKRGTYKRRPPDFADMLKQTTSPTALAEHYTDALGVEVTATTVQGWKQSLRNEQEKANLAKAAA